MTSGVALALALAGCGGSGDGAPPGDASAASAGAACKAAGPTPGASMSWLDDGTRRCADFVSATHSTSGGFDILSVTGGSTANLGLTFKLTAAGKALAASTYTCDGVYVVLVYQQGALASHTTQSCTITVTSLGSDATPATGTFSATLLGPDRTTKTLGEGAFSAVPRAGR